MKRHILTKKAQGRKRSLRKGVLVSDADHAEREEDAAGIGRTRTKNEQRTTTTNKQFDKEAGQIVLFVE